MNVVPAAVSDISLSFDPDTKTQKPINQREIINGVAPEKGYRLSEDDQDLTFPRFEDIQCFLLQRNTNAAFVEADAVFKEVEADWKILLAAKQKLMDNHRNLSAIDLVRSLSLNALLPIIDYLVSKIDIKGLSSDSRELIQRLSTLSSQLTKIQELFTYLPDDPVKYRSNVRSALTMIKELEVSIAFVGAAVLTVLGASDEQIAPFEGNWRRRRCWSPACCPSKA